MGQIWPYIVNYIFVSYLVSIVTAVTLDALKVLVRWARRRIRRPSLSHPLDTLVGTNPDQVTVVVAVTRHTGVR